MWEWSRRKPLGGPHRVTDERLFPADCVEKPLCIFAEF
jgi:hypothetical protein